MSDISNIIGKRIRNYRIKQNLSQEKLAELAGCHPTYIGQIERGEKNATIESIEKITKSLNIPLSRLFEKISEENTIDNIPLKCYEFISAKSYKEQLELFELLTNIEKYKNL